MWRFYKFYQISTLVLYLVCRYFSHRNRVSSASAWQTGGRGFKLGLELYILVAEKIPVLTERLIIINIFFRTLTKPSDFLTQIHEGFLIADKRE